MTTNKEKYEQNVIKINVRIMQNNFLIRFYKARIKYLGICFVENPIIEQFRERVAKLEAENNNLRANKVLLSL